MRKTAIIFVLCSVAAAVVLQHKITWKESKRSKMIRSGEWAHYRKFLEESRNVRASQLNVIPQPYDADDDGELVAHFHIGTPPQRFLLLLDTGTANLWVTSDNCTNYCAAFKFHPQNSTTFVSDNRPWEVQFPEGEMAKGILGQDTFTLGDVDDEDEDAVHLDIPKTTFGMAYEIPDSLEFDGILGLGFTSLAQNDVTPPLINAVNQNLFDKPLFTIHLRPNKVYVDYTGGGVVTFGAVDTHNCGPIIAYQPLSAAKYWQFNAAGVQMAGFSVKQNFAVMSDTNSPTIGGPLHIVARIAMAAGAELNDEGLYTIDCKGNGTFDITIGSNIYSIEPKNYVETFGKSYCYFNIEPFSGGGFGPSWRLGTPLIKQYCHIYDIGQQRIGFAPNIKTN